MGTAARHWTMILMTASLGVTAAPVAGLQVTPPSANQDRPGGDFFSFDLPFSEFDAPVRDGAATCSLACAKHGNCRSYTFVRAGVQGPRARCYLKSSVPAAVTNACCASGVRTGSRIDVVLGTAPGASPYFEVLNGMDRAGSDYQTRVLAAGATAAQCQTLCAQDGRCRAFTYTRPTAAGATPRCWLKSSQPPATPCPDCTSGVKRGASHVAADIFGSGVGAAEAVDPVRPLVVVLLNFTASTVTNAYAAGQTRDYYERLVFGPAEPNIASYFHEASGGRFAFVKGGIIGPINVATVTATTAATRTLAKQLAASNGIRFANFDRNGDGTISDTELTILVIDNLSYDLSQTSAHCASVNGQQNCADVSLLGLNTSFDNIAHELAHTIEQWDTYGATAIGCLGGNMTLASCTQTGGTLSQNLFLSVMPDPWHRMYWGWTLPLVVSLSDYGACTVLEARQGGQGNTVLFYDPNRSTSEFYMAAYHNPALPSFRQTNYMDPQGATLQRALSYDDDFPGQGVLFWWVQTTSRTPFNRAVGIAPGGDGVLQSASALRGDDTLAPGSAFVLAGPDGILQTPVNSQDVQLNDMTLFPSYDPRTHRASRWGAPSLLINGETPVVRWLDGSVSSAFRIRVPALAANAARTEIEWGSLQLRVDGIRPAELRSSDTGFTVTGLFGVDDRGGDRRGLLRARSTGRTYRLQSARWGCGTVTFRRPAGLTPGEYDFEMVSASDRDSNRVLLRVR